MSNYVTPVQIVVDTEALLDQIGWRATRYTHDGEPYEEGGPVDIRRDLAAEVARQLAPSVEDDIRKAVLDAVTEAVTEQVAAIVADTLAGQIQRTNSYGERTGEAITLREMVVAEAREVLTKKVDSRSGKPDRYGRDTVSYVQYIAHSAAKEALRGELNTAVTEAVAEVKSTVADVVSAELADRIAKAVTR